MTAEKSLADLWRYMEAGRGREAVSSLVQSWLHACIERHEQISPDLLYGIIEKRLDWPSGEYYTPKSVTSFISRLASLHSAQSVLDPTCGLGLLLNDVAASVGAQVIHGIDINTECREVAQAVVGNKATILQGDALISPDSLRTAYDLIVADPPFGLKVRGTPKLPHLDEHFRGDMGHALAVWACARLSDNGTAMLIVTPSFLWDVHALQAQAAIWKNRCRVRALINLPGGTFPHTSISTYLAIFERGEQHDVFVGQFAESPEYQKSLITNYKRRKVGEHPGLGRLCPLSAFRGFDAYAAQERLNRLVRATGWPQHAAGLAILKAERLSASDGGSEQFANSLFLRLSGHPTAMLDATTLPRSALRDCACLSINPEIADARYLVQWFNRSPVGQATVASVIQGGVLARLDLNALLATNLCLPPLTEQRHVIQGIEHLNRIRAEATELETVLCTSTKETDAVIKRIKTINQEDRYVDWLETLPFPLASILWRHHAGIGSTREQYEVLLHFFEATAAFVATIHLSAFMTNDSLLSDVAKGLHDNLAKQHLKLERATFGAWKLVVEYLSGRCRKLLGEGDGEETCERIYGTTNRHHIAMICHPDLLMALQAANNIRNKSSGHGGAIGEGEARRIHDDLQALVHKIRGVFARSWLDYELIQPSNNELREGIHHNKVRRLMGAHSAPFQVVERKSTQALETDRLYLFDSVGQKGILLRPFIRVMPSPEKKANACFIFSRREQGGAHFVSYHFEDESSLTDSFPDIDEAFRRIHLFDAGARP